MNSRGLPVRRSLRLRNFDYSTNGAYFVTVCTHNRRQLLGHVRDGVMRESGAGGIVRACWLALPTHYSNASLDVFVVMPNHFHGIVWLNGGGHALSEIVRAFKAFSSRQKNVLLQSPGNAVWQRGYHERVIRHERQLDAVRRYIEENPLKWGLAREKPAFAVSGAPRAGWNSSTPACRVV